ncbi:alpha-N-arabinofuranosidase [Haloferula luteola]|uniref:non-reducing end alpha-L-arabinofuranosidase n=1 Tax=Haloferula luteola TaxID=595692 RepID=A0A840V6C4_9BACT|nr:alpha-L-arabinofuranosidase C-terminal domain-containing protein [Haloferula luteola]MBB5350328.1 alpha-N-arabinofuranosidase [Haloferula luteola]
MKTQSLLLFLASAAMAGAATLLTIDGSKAVAMASPIHYGLMTEEINFCYDGGLYAELVRNRSFRDDPEAAVHWSEWGSAVISLDAAQPFNEAIPASLRVEAKAAGEGVTNEGYWGIPIHPATQYRASLRVKGGKDFHDTLKVSLVSNDGATVYASATTPALGEEWLAIDLVLETAADAPTTADARLQIELAKPGTCWLGFASLFPPTWNDRPNGLRKDLMQMLVDMKPKFLRFPGGNYLEGDTIETRFKWWETLGPVTERPGHPCPWGYRSSDGMGLMEFLLWCEDMGAEPVLGLYAGYSLKGDFVAPGKDLEPFVQEALDEIEYVMGPPTSKWGARRAKDGHPAPFKMRYVEIGNEDWFDKSGSYDGRFAQFYDAIKKKYPKLKCISSVGSEQPKEKWVKSRKPDVLDEHFYRRAEVFREMAKDYYDGFDRKGPEIFVGEWAAHETPFAPWEPASAKEPATPNMTAAIGDAAFMTNMERNSDIVTMQAYAPLFVNLNGRQWRPDLIGYDAVTAYGSPSYYALRMFSTNFGDEILKAELPADAKVFTSVTRRKEDGKVFVKLVNPELEPQTVTLVMKGFRSLDSTVETEVMAAGMDATNRLDQPVAVIPEVGKWEGVKRKSDYEMPAHSIVVLTFQTR